MTGSGKGNLILETIFKLFSKTLKMTKKSRERPCSLLLDSFQSLRLSSFRNIRLITPAVVVVLSSTASRMNGFAPSIIIGTRRIVFCPGAPTSCIWISVANGRKVVVVGVVRLCFVMAGHVSAVLFDIATLIPCALCEGKRRCHHCDDQDDK